MSDTLKAWQSRLQLSEHAMAAYLGVPVHTLRKWINGTRRPDSAPLRLFAVLQLVEAHAPDLHRAVMQAAQDAAPAAHSSPVTAKKGRGRVKVAPAAENAATAAPAAPVPPAAPAPWIHAADALPAWMNTGAGQ